MTSTEMALTLERATEKIRRVRENTLEALSRAAQETAVMKERIRRDELRRSLEHKQLVHARIRLAAQAVEMLCGLGESEQFQALIRAREKPLTLWGGETKPVSPGGDMSDVSWSYGSLIQLDADTLRVWNYSKTNGKYDDFDCLFLNFPYTGRDGLLHYRLLGKIATAKPFPREYDDDDHLLPYRDDEWHQPDVLFDQLVILSDPDALGTLLKETLGT